MPIPIRMAVRVWFDDGSEREYEVRSSAGDAMERPGFLKDCRIDRFHNIAESSVRVTHLPTGVQAAGATLEEAARILAESLIGRGDITINSARAAMGMPEFREDFANGR